MPRGRLIIAAAFCVGCGPSVLAIVGDVGQQPQAKFELGDEGIDGAYLAIILADGPAIPQAL